MKVVRKDATITSTGTDDDFPGTFEVILSAPTTDRDGDTLLPEDWKQPLPEHITFDIDHGMSVETTVGSGKPEIDDDGNLVVRGTFSSLPRAQEVRTLVREGHINRTSVAFMNERQKTKDGKTRSVRELLNGAFVAIPSNREAVILSSKSLDDVEVKYSPDQERDEHGRFSGGGSGGAGNVATAEAHLGALKDNVAMMAAVANRAGLSENESVNAALSRAGAAASLAKTSQMMRDTDRTLQQQDNHLMHMSNAAHAIAQASPEHALAARSVLDRSYANVNGYDSSMAAARAEAASVRSVDGVEVKEYTEEQLITSTDAIIDAALTAIENIDTESLPAEVQQIFALIQAADVAVDELMELAGVDDPDDETESADGEAAEESAAAKSADEVAIEARAIKLIAESFK